MNRSLQWRLSLMLGGALLLAGVAAAVVSSILAYAEAKEFQDDMLRQIALLSARTATHSTEIVASRETRADLALDDQEARISVIRLPGDTRPGWLVDDWPSGFRTLETSNGRLRIFVLKESSGKATVVAQPTDVRDEIALNSALRTLVPLLLFLPVMAWLIVRIVRRELLPVSRLAGDLDGQPADRPHSLPDSDIPDEIVPFVHAINRLLIRVGELLGQQRRFIADAAHELRTPLTALSLQAQNLRQAGTLESMHERVLPLQSGIERARKLTEQLLSLARIQAGTLETAEVDVSVMARELIAEYLPMAEAKEIDLGLDEVALLTLFTAEETLRLVLRNALENALKYAPEGGKVTLRLYVDGNDAVIEIVDNGPGIPATERERIMDPFYRMPGVEGEGSGLGLAIASEAAVRLGGRIALLDRPEGSGLIFRYRQNRC